jgi:pimeloyl-ACP methyl ester carboxylesterase
MSVKPHRTSKEELPFHGRWLRAKRKQFLETVIFVHHFGGNRTSVKPHQDFLADLGFDSVAFTLSHRSWPGPLKNTLLNDVHYKLRHRWQNEIAAILQAVPGPKILFSFSFPSAPAIMAVAERRVPDIQAWICDGGPFLSPLTCFWNYFKFADPTPLWKRGPRMLLGMTSLEFWNLGPELHEALDRLPHDFPVLSIRAWQDQLVPISAIDEAFSGHHNLKLETLTLPEGGHIDGLKRFPEEYKPRVARFLNHVATALNGESNTNAEP